MKKNRNIWLAISLLVLVAVFAMVILIKKGDSTNRKETAAKIGPVAGKETDATIITFTVPDICKIDDDNLQHFNDDLIKDGHDYMLRIKYLEYDKYAELLEEELKTGDTDIAFLGLGDAGGTNNIYTLIHSGLLLNLDGILSQEPGAALYAAFPQNLWESVKCDRHIYSIPSALVDDQGVYAAFNRDYIADADIDDWDGSIQGIYEMIKDVEWKDSDAPRFQYLINDYSFEDMIGCEIRYGLIFDYGSLSIENPLESEKFIGYLNVLDQMKKDGYMDDSISYLSNAGLNSAETMENIEAGNYLAALSCGAVDEVFLKDNITVKTVKPYLSSRINGSVAISKNTDNADDVVDFLGLFYGEGKYGNILLYGQEDLDYKVMDGVACNTDGTDLEDDYINKLCLNLFVNTYPVRGENYMSNRKNEIFSFYDSMKLSPFIGFEPDTAAAKDILNDMGEFMNSLKDKTVDEAVEGARDRFISDGIDEYLTSVKGQWEEYRQ